MKLASLFSGGKDSAFAIYSAQKLGHQVTCLLTVMPSSDDSHLLHHPNVSWTKLQSELMNVPQLVGSVKTIDTDSELLVLEELLQKAKDVFDIEGLVHGGIASNFQKEKFEKLCKKLDLQSVAPLWHREPREYLNTLLDNRFEFIITSVSSDGLDDRWLGKAITSEDLLILENLSKKFGFNLNFEGGEAETFVTCCPLFSKCIKIHEGKKIWDGYRGRFEIVDAGVNNNA